MTKRLAALFTRGTYCKCMPRLQCRELCGFKTCMCSSTSCNEKPQRRSEKTPKQNTSMQNIAGIKPFALNGNVLSDVPSDSVCFFSPPPEQFTLIIHCRGNNCILHERVEGV